MRYLLLTTTLTVMALLGACGGERVSGNQIPSIELKDGQRIVTKDSTLSVRADLPATVRVRNIGNGDLLIKDITIASDPVGAFTLVSMPMPTAAAPIEIAPEGLGHQFTVSYDPSVPSPRRASATVIIRTNQTLNVGEEVRFNLVPEVASGRLIVNPPILDFGVVSANAHAIKSANILNTGSAPLAINRMIFGGHAGFTVTLAGVEYVVSAESASNGLVLNPPVVVGAGSAQKVDVRYVASGDEAAKGKLLFFHDGGDIGGVSLELFANLTGPCIKTNPAIVAFGGKLVGMTATTDVKIESCGDVDLVLSDIEMYEDANGQFAVNEAAAGTFPLTLSPGATATVPVTFMPTAPAATGADGSPVVERGLLRFTSNAFRATHDVTVEGFGTDGRCPVADIQITEGLEVLAQTKLNLSGAGSVSAAGAIAAYEWTVVQPSGSLSQFMPSAYVAAPTFEANVVGDYIFRLNVIDVAGNRSCAAAERVVHVSSDDSIHVELLWRTPGDINESDTGGDDIYFSMGSDVDLHFLSPRAAGTYFDSINDCFWRNQRPEWGAATPFDNPRLDLDDRDGGGPENLNVAIPEQGVRYQVGVHVWNDWGYGKVYATVRVYIYGTLRDQWEEVELINDEMWDTHYIDWPTGVVTRIGTAGSPQIRQNARP